MKLRIQLFTFKQACRQNTFLPIKSKLHILLCHSLDLVIEQLRNNGTALGRARSAKGRLMFSWEELTFSCCLGLPNYILNTGDVCSFLIQPSSCKTPFYGFRLMEGIDGNNLLPWEVGGCVAK